MLSGWGFILLETIHSSVYTAESVVAVERTTYVLLTFNFLMFHPFLVSAKLHGLFSLTIKGSVKRRQNQKKKHTIRY